MNAGAVARAQGAITAFQHALGEVVCEVAEQQERAEAAEARVRELEREIEERGPGDVRLMRAEYRRGYSAGHKAGLRGAPAEPRRRAPLRVVEGKRAA